MKITASALVLATSASLSNAFAFAPASLSHISPIQSRSKSALSAVGKQASYSVTLLPGDGIGPEITEATVGALNTLTKHTDWKIDFTESLIGGAALDATDNKEAFPDLSLEQCRASDSILLACIGGYKWDNNPREARPETGLLKMRSKMGLFANLRPAKVLPQLIGASTLKPEVIEGVDIMVVRELTGDVYFGTPKGIDVIDGERVGYNNMIYKESEIRRIARVAGDVAMKRGGKICSVEKSNVLDVSQLWKEVTIDVMEKEFPKVDLSHMYVDNAAMQLIRYPKQFDTIVTGNIFGDILSDEASMLVGSLGMLPSASIGESGPGVFEPCHGSAPDIAGEDKANPLAMILSAAMMLRYDLSRGEEADLLEKAVEMCLDQGWRTPDIKQDGDGCTLVGCKEMGGKVCAAIEELMVKA